MENTAHVFLRGWETYDVIPGGLAAALRTLPCGGGV